MADLSLRKADLGTLEPLGSGGTARIYRAPSYRAAGVEVVYKEYKRKTLQQAGRRLGPGLHAIARHPETLDGRQRQLIDERTIWPLSVIEDDAANVVGIIMRLIPARYFQPVSLPSGKVETNPREVQLLFMDDGLARKTGVPLMEMPERVALCGQIATAVGLLHRAGVVFGDVSARNVIYDPSARPLPEVLLVDCDSVRVAGTVSPFGSQPHTPHWEPPEAKRARRRLQALRGSDDEAEIRNQRRRMMIQCKQTDVYKYGLLVVRVLDYGAGRSPNTNPTKALTVLRRFANRDVADVLSGSLAESPDDRPTMRDWYDAFTGRRSAAREGAAAPHATGR